METSWEVCNKVGGIYTVLSTKAKVLKEQLGDRLVFIGPDVWSEHNPSPYFRERPSLLRGFARLEGMPYGISVRVGRWIIPSMPIAVLVKFEGLYSHLNEYYGEMWRHYGVDSLHAYGDYPEGCAFAIAASIVMEHLSRHLGVEAPTAHFNEWTTGAGLLNLQQRMPRAVTLFTTHATSIGRSICSNGKALYDYFEGYHGTQMAGELNMEAKHSLERAAAHAADCFTTVSEVTARECEQLLDIRPQVITPNGFEPAFVPDPTKLAHNRAEGRRRLLKIARSLTGRQIADDALIVATSGRGEFRNKGIDLFVDSIDRLGTGNRDVATFILVPGWVDKPATHDRFKTHSLHNECDDVIANRLRHRSTDLTPIIYVPCYLDGHDGVVDMPYYDLLPALDLTVFPSYYEPWGYTPLESIAFGVPTVTTDKAGFGAWIEENFTPGIRECGVEVIHRTDSNFAECSQLIAKQIEGFATLSDPQREDISLKARHTASRADWSLFVSRYFEAFEVADRRAAERLAR